MYRTKMQTEPLCRVLTMLKDLIKQKKTNTHTHKINAFCLMQRPGINHKQVNNNALMNNGKQRDNQRTIAMQNR